MTSWDLHSNVSDKKQMGRNSVPHPKKKLVISKLREALRSKNKQGSWIENDATGEELKQKGWPGTLSPRSCFLSRDMKDKTEAAM